MTYKDWCKYSKEILAEAKEVNEWADKAKNHLLTSIGPRLAKLDKSGYYGCGFHYSLEQDFGRLIVDLSVSWQPCANWCQKVEDDREKFLITRVIYESLLEQVEKAEKTVKPERQAGRH